tara:strand:+ start:366 stop:557 length:192 start_codon:yes stop_codon:yes gene_type:complete
MNQVTSNRIRASGASGAGGAGGAGGASGAPRADLHAVGGRWFNVRASGADTFALCAGVRRPLV